MSNGKGLSRAPGWGTTPPPQRRAAGLANQQGPGGIEPPLSGGRALPSAPLPVPTEAPRDREPTTEAVWVPARVYWEGQLYSARTPKGVEEWEFRAPEPLRAVEALREFVACELGVPLSRVRFMFASFPRGYNPPPLDFCAASDSAVGDAIQGLTAALYNLADWINRPDVQEAMRQVVEERGIDRRGQ